MSIFKCPTNCEDHDYDFPHTVVRATRVIDQTLVITDYVCCRACGHWLSFKGACNCRFRCHQENGATTVHVIESTIQLS